MIDNDYKKNKQLHDFFSKEILARLTGKKTDCKLKTSVLIIGLRVAQKFIIDYHFATDKQ